MGSASGADKWNTARNFQVSDSDAAHTGTAVSVNGSKAIVLPLPATIKATLEGNASSANKVNHKYYFLSYYFNLPWYLSNNVLK